MKEKIKQLEKLYENLSDLTPEKVETLVTEVMGVFEELVSKIQSGTEDEKKEALACAEELRESLEAQAKQALTQLDIEPENLENYMNNPSNFSEEEWHTLQNTKKDLDSYQEDLAKSGLIQQDHLTSPTKIQNKKKKPAMWVAG